MKNKCTPLFVAAMLAWWQPLAVVAQTEVTSGYLQNASFENGTANWESSNFKTQTNASFSPKDGTTYLEQWVSAGSTVSDAYVRQTLHNLPAGSYELRAAAQSLQDGAAASGAVLVAGDAQTAVGACGEYSVRFTCIDGEVTIGFQATSSQANWLACDNFRLYRLSTDLAALHAELQQRIGEAETTLSAKPDGAESAALRAAIDAATAELSATTADNLASVANALSAALLKFRVMNSEGKVPTVVTHKRFTRSATHIYGRSTVSGVATSRIKEQGFCWSTSPEPTIFDHRTTDYLSSNGNVYKLSGLTPATVYYIRAYALTTDYAVGYGNTLKVITIPKGNISYTYDDGGSEAENIRIRQAVITALNYWNDATSLQSFAPSVHYGASTPTADCSYGGWMRVGPVESYQATGTIMHEMAHGIGVGTHSVWTASDSPLREGEGTGYWLGDRANDVVRFWKNDDTQRLNGDGTHMWPYGVNGAHEDDKSEVLYTANAQIVQALGEDGLPPEGGFGTPAYSFEHTEGVKYYLKNEDESRGRETSFLVADESGTLRWQALGTGEAASNDNAAWTVTFDPTTCLYTLKNVGMGLYMSYNESKTTRFCATSADTPSQSEAFHLMRGRLDVTVGEGSEALTTRGYWIVHPESTLNPHTLGAQANGRAMAVTFDLRNSAAAQRWIILNAAEIRQLEVANQEKNNAALAKLLIGMKQLQATPHTEDAAGADAAFAEAISKAEESAAAASALTSDGIAAATSEAHTATTDFLKSVTPISADTPFDISFLMTDADYTDLTAWSSTPADSGEGCVAFSGTFSFTQRVSQLPAGTYAFSAQAFHRPGDAKTAYANYIGGTSDASAEIFAASKSQKLQHQAAGAQEEHLGGKETRVATSPNRYVPANLLSASVYFEAGIYPNRVVTSITTDGGSLLVGFRNTKSIAADWAVIGSPSLLFYGTMSENDATGIATVRTDARETYSIYTLGGVCIRRNAKNLEGLHPGVYIVNGRKTIVK